MNRNVIIILGVFILLVVVFIAFSRQPSTAPQPTDRIATTQPTLEATPGGVMTVTLNEQNNSGESGVATLTEQNGQVVVNLSINGYTDNIPQPAHIHLGTCPGVGSVKYPLTNVINGISETTLNVTLAQLQSELPLGINVHKSVPEASVYTACGDLESIQ